MSDLTERLRKASFQEWREYPSAHIHAWKHLNGDFDANQIAAAIRALKENP